MIDKTSICLIIKSRCFIINNHPHWEKSFHTNRGGNVSSVCYVCLNYLVLNIRMNLSKIWNLGTVHGFNLLWHVWIVHILINFWWVCVSRRQFHQHFTRNFFANILASKNWEAKRNKRKAAQFTFVRKTLAQDIDEIDSFFRFKFLFVCYFSRIKPSPVLFFTLTFSKHHWNQSTRVSIILKPSHYQA